MSSMWTFAYGKVAKRIFAWFRQAECPAFWQGISAMLMMKSGHEAESWSLDPSADSLDVDT